MTAPGPTLWLDPSFGASGDMLLGALLGLGAPLDAVRSDVAALGLSGWTIEVEPVLRAGIAATRALVSTDEGHHHRTWSSIDAMLAEAALPEPVVIGARHTFLRLGEVEAGIHRIELDAVHFHEVGALDAIVDIVGVWSAVHHLGVEAVVTGPVGLGHGHVGAAHGMLPTPAPATAELLRGAPVQPLDVAMETVTPTGAALLDTLGQWGPVPAGRLGPTARGAGGRDPDGHPNVVTALLVTPDPAAASMPDGAAPDGAAHTVEGATALTPDPAAASLRDGAAHTVEGATALTPDPAADNPDGATTVRATVLATNLDDATPEVIGHTIERLLDAGADDAWVVPVLMKKGRPGQELRVLCSPEAADPLRRLLFTETGTRGIRAESVNNSR
ncbi:MAG: LarC family nickel insertion protein, partial [Actinomycetota bacterium]